MIRRSEREVAEHKRLRQEIVDALASEIHGSCARCRAVAWEALTDEDDLRGLGLAARLCREHAVAGPAFVRTPNALEERLPFPLARRLLKLGGIPLGGSPSKSGVREGEIPLGSATLGIRFAREDATALVRISVEPPPAGDRSLHQVEAIALGWDQGYESARDACLERFEELKALALADLEIEPPGKREIEAPFRPQRKPPELRS